MTEQADTLGDLVLYTSEGGLANVQLRADEADFADFERLSKCKGGAK